MGKFCILKFFFDKNDPEFVSKTIIVDDTPGNYISHVFIKCPIYQKDCSGIKIQIGYKVADDYVQQVGINEYLVRINSTYYFDDAGTITWQYSFVNNVPQVYYPLEKIAVSNIICTTGYYLGKKGYVYLKPTEDGLRKVKILFR